MVDRQGFEPWTFGLQDRRSPGLSYATQERRRPRGLLLRGRREGARSANYTTAPVAAGAGVGVVAGARNIMDTGYRSSAKSATAHPSTPRPTTSRHSRSTVWSRSILAWRLYARRASRAATSATSRPLGSTGCTARRWSSSTIGRTPAAWSGPGSDRGGSNDPRGSQVRDGAVAAGAWCDCSPLWGG